MDPTGAVENTRAEREIGVMEDLAFLCARLAPESPLRRKNSIIQYVTLFKYLVFFLEGVITHGKSRLRARVR